MRRIVPALLTSAALAGLALSACVAPAEFDSSARTTDIRSVTAGRPVDPATYLPEDVEGWSVETVPDTEVVEPDGMQIATRLLRPPDGSSGLSPVILSAIVFDDPHAAELSMLPYAMGEHAVEADVAGRTVWLVESTPQSCAALWPASDDTLVVAADGSCETVLTAMGAVLE